MIYNLSQPILSDGIATATQIDAWFQRYNPNAPPLGDAILAAHLLSGVNQDFLAAEIGEETGYWTSDRALLARNPSGLGATDDGAWGVVFATPTDGIRATVSHWRTYTDGESNPLAQYDPRYAVTLTTGHAGTISTVGQIGNGIWATDPTYNTSVLSRMNDLVATLTPPVIPPEPPPMTAPTIIDISGILYRNPTGGPNYQNDNKVGIVWHYNGPPPNPDARTQYTNDAVYHAQKDWGNGNFGDGIMYHYGIQSGDGGSDPDGTIYRLRAEADVLWHCGAWVPGGNDTGIAININIGEGENASAAAIASAKWLANDIRARRGIVLVMCKGHQELSPTACPGSEMNDLVIPYRNGETGGTVPPVVTDNFLHENGFIVGGGFKSIVDQMEAISHVFRMRFLGYAISNEGDGYLLSPETRDDGSTTGKYHVKKVTVQKFERNTLIHEPDEPTPVWQDVVPLVNRGFLAGFADDPAIDAVLKNPAAQV